MTQAEERKVIEAVKTCAHIWDNSVYIPYCLSCGVDFEAWLALEAGKLAEYARLHS